MKNVSKIIPCYAADTSGVCSALYEFGGMIVVHDASGCNSTYSTHDEPRWYDMRSDIYISALTETDAILGNDEKLIEDIVSAAKDRKPAFIALCGSPMPMMTGFDYEAVARDIQGRTGIPTFGLATNGTRSYISGAGMALEAIVREFVHDMPKEDFDGIAINIIGATPLDFGLTGAVESMKKLFSECGIKVISSIGMGGTLDEIKNAASAKANLVVSYCGLPAARYMEKEFGIPYICGVPLGDVDTIQAGALSSFMYETAHDGISRMMAAMCRGRATDEKAERLVIGEAVLSGSIAYEWEALTRHAVDVLCPPDIDAELSPDKKDMPIYAEEDIKAYIKDRSIKEVVADSLYKYIIPEGCRLIELPHFAFSGRCFAKDMKDLIGKNLAEELGLHL